MQDKSIHGALLALRKNIIRGKLDDLAHVEALLTLRGVHMPAVLPAKTEDAAKMGQMTRLVREAIRGGQMTTRALTDIVAAARPKISPEDAGKRTAQVLCNMKFAGALVRDGRMWGLAS